MLLKHQSCINCLMDTTDPNINFNIDGICDYCINFKKKILPQWNKNISNFSFLENKIEEIKSINKNRNYDCLVGISGGVDSSYLVYFLNKYKLRPLLFHVDAGWNTNAAVYNIERLLKKLSLDLHTEVLDWETIKDLQLAYFKAGVPHLDTIQDHAFFASIYNFAVKNNINTVFTGYNYSSECIREPLLWHYHASDLRQLKNIHKIYGKHSMKLFPQSDIFKFKIYYKYFKKLKLYNPLNYMKYDKDEAVKILKKELDWLPYGEKHYESRFTKFYEGYWLKDKFGYDKRKAHLSSMILSKLISRDEALKKLSLNPYDDISLNNDLNYICNKLDISMNYLMELKNMPNKTYKDFKSNHKLISLGTIIYRLLGWEKRIIR